MSKMSDISKFVAIRPYEKNGGVLSGIVNAASGKITKGPEKVTDEEITLVEIPSYMAEIFGNQAEQNGYKVTVLNLDF